MKIIKMRCRHEMSRCCNGADRLLQCRLALDLKFVKKQNKTKKHNICEMQQSKVHLNEVCLCCERGRE